MVLAEDAAQIAAGEEDRARAPLAAKAVLLAEVRKVGRDHRVTPDAAETGMVGEAVDLALAGTDHAPLGPEQYESPTRALLELAAAIQRQIGRLEPVHRWSAKVKRGNSAARRVPRDPAG